MSSQQRTCVFLKMSAPEAAAAPVEQSNVVDAAAADAPAPVVEETPKVEAAVVPPVSCIPFVPLSHGSLASEIRPRHLPLLRSRRLQLRLRHPPPLPQRRPPKTTLSLYVAATVSHVLGSYTFLLPSTG